MCEPTSALLAVRFYGCEYETFIVIILIILLTTNGGYTNRMTECTHINDHHKNRNNNVYPK